MEADSILYREAKRKMEAAAWGRFYDYLGRDNSDAIRRRDMKCRQLPLTFKCT